MVMKAFGRSAFRLFTKHLVRLITIIAIVTVSIGITSGIGEVEGRIKSTVNDIYKKQNVSDFYVKSKRTMGFTADELNYMAEKFGAENVMLSFCYEIPSVDDNGIIKDVTRVYYFDFDNSYINKIMLLKGKLPSAKNEILSERGTEELEGYAIGETVKINGQNFTVCGIVLNPLLISKIEEPSFTDPARKLDHVIYFDSEPQIVNDVYAVLSDRSMFRSFGNGYEKQIDRLKSEISDFMGGENASVLSLYENSGLYAIVSYAEKVGLIGIVFVVFFLLVTMLVVYANMARLYDEERGQLACLKTLGYSDISIVGRYTLFVFIGTLLGGLLALPLGMGLTALIYSSFNMQYTMPPFPGTGHMVYYLMTFAAIMLSTLLLTLFSGLKTVGNKPVTLLTPKAPKSGKKVIIERIGFIWKRLSFKYKSTLRNVLLFKSRFFMTVISIIGSTVLVLSGLGLLDCTLKYGNASSLVAISAALIVFSAALCALVIYNLTNINVSERNREIATLMVLGYHDREVTGYIFREIYIMCLIGALLGVPLGLGFLSFVFDLVSFGAIADINWWTWILAPAITMLFGFLSTMLLRRKILKTDMNASLKTLE